MRTWLAASLLVAFFSALGGSAACGGTAVIDGNGGGAGGGGSDGGGGDNTTTTTTMSGPGVTSSSGMVPSLCEQACATLQDCGGGGPDCVTTCESRPEPCRSLHEKWLSCSLGETNTMCGLGPGVVCDPDLRAYLECSGEVVGDSGCSIDPTGCSCSVFVSPGLDFTSQCDFEGCQCFRGGLQVGTCTPDEASCDLPSGGCCAGPLFTGRVQ